jgi:DNA-binding NtrC family response regulator
MGARVLVIDDEPMIRWSVAKTLQAAGHDVTVCETAREGMALYAALRPDVVLVDLRLSDENGATILQAIHKDAGPKTAVIVMTAFEEDCPAETARQLGAFEYLRKPFDFGGLDSLVRRAVNAGMPT